MRLVREMLYDADNKETDLPFIFNLFLSVLSLRLVDMMFTVGIRPSIQTVTLVTLKTFVLLQRIKRLA